ncbi:hypothetical protein CONPUDRAFT_167712 [Coniophora puteana RWD-64-598 SS2]|uniref:FAD-binding domain-containing protein n=1 Tax=Coniophora puteana (strain RWD-64-598) TaxID=741705 RepID=A0A5M3MFY0_CONPW|nr:uncharacterized protein CONPUDRAFT_167712 [Coniophora puteana RWD-64-598 SS2]EIW77525.1 hypothetical protein CONPUDRAFT_167712 [Coniophora puteana RWD-64-598 SS2]
MDGNNSLKRIHRRQHQDDDDSLPNTADVPTAFELHSDRYLSREVVNKWAERDAKDIVTDQSTSNNDDNPCVGRWKNKVGGFRRDWDFWEWRACKVPTRWTPDSPQWQESGLLVGRWKYQRALDALEGLIVVRVFELGKMNQSQTGYTEGVRPAAIRRALDRYNAAARAIKRPTLQWDDVVKYSFLTEIDLLRDSRRNTLRARGGVARLGVGIRRVATYLQDEMKYLRECEDLARPTNPFLAHHIARLRRERDIFAELHTTRLQEIANLPGFNSSIQPGVFKTQEAGDSAGPLPSFAMVAEHACPGDPSDRDVAVGAKDLDDINDTNVNVDKEEEEDSVLDTVIDGDGYQLMMGGAEVDVSATIAGGKEAIYALIQEVVPTKLDFKELIWFGEFRPNIRMADKFGEGRVFIAGDAAHCHSPTGGQGLNSSVQDSFNLAWKLSLVLKGLSPPSLLTTYTTERRPIIAEMLNITTAILNQAALGSDRSWERPDKLRMLGVNYRASPLVLDELSPAADRAPVPAYGEADEALAGALVAGDRAPDAPGMVDREGRAYRMFDILEPVRHTVLVFAPSVGQARDVVEAIEGMESRKDVVRAVVVLPASAEVEATSEVQSMVLRDVDQFAYAGFRAKEGEKRVVVVRPDGYVGAVVRGVDGMERYFKGVFL